MADEDRVGPGGRVPPEQELVGAIPRDPGRKEVRVGIFVILGAAAVVLLLFLLTDPATLRGRYILVTAVEDAGGIRRGDPVQMRGVNIGRIQGFEMDPAGDVFIMLEIEGQWAVPEDSYTRLAGAGLFGGRTMEVIPGRASGLAGAGDTIPGAGMGGGMLESVEGLGFRADTVLYRIQSLLSEPTVESIQSTARGMESLVAELRALTGSQQQELAALTRTLRSAAEGVEAASEAGPDVARAVSRADSAMVVLGRTSRTLDSTALALSTVLGRLERGEGTLGRLSTDETLYLNLNEAAVALARLATDIRENPRRYLSFGIF